MRVIGKAYWMNQVLASAIVVERDNVGVCMCLHARVRILLNCRCVEYLASYTCTLVFLRVLHGRYKWMGNRTRMYQQLEHNGVQLRIILRETHPTSPLQSATLCDAACC